MEGYTVGQTAKICQTSIQTLHFYDKIGLVKPHRVDGQNGYRYYSSQDILQIKIVQDLQSMQFTLEQIGQVLRSKSGRIIPELLHVKRAEAQQAILDLGTIVGNIDQRLRLLEDHEQLLQAFEHTQVVVELKTYPDRFVAFERKRDVCGMETSIIRFMALIDRVKEHGFTTDGHILTIYHDDLLTFDRNDSDIEVCVPLKPAAEEPAFTRWLPGGDYISAVYAGFPNEVSCKGLYQRLRDWMNLNGYAENGPVLERYLIDFTHMRNTDDFIVDLQIPVKSVLTL
ncbi:MerR family transcriptional regulator [Paenibacillus aceris]|uniref:DNA-binding transcriptional MerR regulator/effector-binding domain-containing protein n=1 Tax=Paenibacillus aceris TaxID=869555 RepID=A0ABS4HZ32_9BACL|nr:MerR family transcriptional regulator [Paenibacillus aceris]MBP1963937.1 DNA-binding transcriptional MerR regulator/effector-binding domain-containing protein [Paenibacillus aceris]NHW34644.1 MerR family transcriptional regulator [Paenibacillus aceris]